MKRSSSVSSFNLYLQLSCKLVSSIIHIPSCLTVLLPFFGMIYCLRLSEEVKVVEVNSTYHLSTCLRPIYIADARQALKVFLGAVDGIHCGSLYSIVCVGSSYTWYSYSLQIEKRSYIWLEETINLLASLSLTTQLNFVLKFFKNTDCFISCKQSFS